MEVALKKIACTLIINEYILIDVSFVYAMLKDKTSEQKILMDGSVYL